MREKAALSGALAIALVLILPAAMTGAQGADSTDLTASYFPISGVGATTIECAMVLHGCTLHVQSDWLDQLHAWEVMLADTKPKPDSFMLMSRSWSSGWVVQVYAQPLGAHRTISS